MNIPSDHAEKFKELLNLIATTKSGNVMVVDHPGVLGDTYEELIVNLDALAEAGLRLRIVPPSGRTA